MEYTELQKLWENRNLPQIEVSIKQAAIDELTSYKLKRNLSEIKWTAIFEILITFLWYVFLLNFLMEHYQNPVYLWSGIILILIAIISIFIEARKLYLYKTIDYGCSILKAQTQVEKLKFLEKLDLNLIYLFLPLFWLPFPVWLVRNF